MSSDRSMCSTFVCCFWHQYTTSVLFLYRVDLRRKTEPIFKIQHRRCLNSTTQECLNSVLNRAGPIRMRMKTDTRMHTYIRRISEEIAQTGRMRMKTDTPYVHTRIPYM